jgi:hypothetical protein
MKDDMIEATATMDVGPYTDCYTLYCPLCQRGLTHCCDTLGENKCNDCKIEIIVYKSTWTQRDEEYDIDVEVLYKHIPPLIPYRPLPTPSYVKVETTEKIKEELKERYKIEDLHG